MKVELFDPKNMYWSEERKVWSVEIPLVDGRYISIIAGQNQRSKPSKIAIEMTESLESDPLFLFYMDTTGHKEIDSSSICEYIDWIDSTLHARLVKKSKHDNRAFLIGTLITLITLGLMLKYG